MSTASDIQSAIEEIAALARQLSEIPLGREVFSRTDDAWLRAYVALAAGADIDIDALPLAYHIEAARRLAKHGDKLDGAEARAEVVALLEGHAAQTKQSILRPDSKLYNANKGQAKGGHWLWGLEEQRNAKGFKFGGPCRVAFSTQGDLKALMAETGLDAKAWTFQKVANTWYVEIDLEHIGAVADVLDRTDKEGLADALRTNRLLWEQVAREYKTRQAKHEAKLEAQKKAERERLVASKPVDDELLRKAKALMRTFQRMAKLENRKNEAFYTKGVSVVIELLQQGLKGGALKHTVRFEGADLGKWAVHGRGSDECIYVHTPAHIRGWEKAVKGGKNARLDGVFYDYWPIDKTLQVSRALEDSNLALALSLRLALLVEETVKDTAALEMLSAMDRAENIPDREVREQVKAIADSVPFPAGVKPYQFQYVGIAYAKMTGFRCLIGDSMGLGKSLQAIGCLNLAPQDLVPAVIMAPASVTYNWKNELAKFAPWFEVIMIDGTMNAIPDPRPGRTVYILSWDMLDRMADELIRLGIKTMICDESHRVKHSTAKRTRAAMDLSKAIPHRLLLSGTAMENKPSELWTQLHIIDPEEFPSMTDFEARYANLRVMQVRGRVIKTEGEGGAGLDDLADRLRAYMIRRTKTQVLQDLPAKTRRSLWIELPKEAVKAYKHVEAEMLDYLCARQKQRALETAAKRYVNLVAEGKAQVEAATIAIREANTRPPDADIAQMAIVKMGRLRHLIGELKAPLALQWVEDYFQESKKPLIVFCEHKKVVETLQAGLSKMGLRHATVSGGVPNKRRGEIVAAFQAGQLDVFIGTQAADTGITLTAADTTLFVERWWVPAREEQAEDRSSRIGQKSATTANYLMAPGTVDDHIAALVDKKRALVEQVMGGERVLSESERAEIVGNGEEDSVSISLAKQLAAKVMSQMREARGQDCQVGIQDLRLYLRERGLL